MEIIKKTEKEKELLMKKIFSWAGGIFIIMSIVLYLIVVYIYIKGFTTQINGKDATIFAIISGVFGILMVIGANDLGVNLASNTEDAKTVSKEYIDLLPTSKDEKPKYQSITKYKIIEIIKAIFSKGLGIGLSSYLLISFVVQGVQDNQYMLLALGNILLSLSIATTRVIKSYDAYFSYHIPWLKVQIDKIKNENKTEGTGDVGEHTKTITRASSGDVQFEREPGRDKEIIEDSGRLEESGNGTSGDVGSTSTIEERLRGSSEDTNSGTQEYTGTNEV